MNEAQRCGARTRSGGRCAGRPMTGAARCRMHGGAAPQALRAAAVRTAESQARALLGKLEIAPCDDPLQALSRLAGEVLTWRDLLRAKVRELSDLAGTDALGVERARAVVELYERSLDRVGKVLTAIAKLNLEERVARVEERQVELLSQAFERGLLASGLDSAAQREVRVSVARELRLVSGGSN